MGSHQQQQAETFLYPYAKSSSISPPHHQDHHRPQQNSAGSTSTSGELLGSFDSFLSPELVRKVVAELIATYLLVFVTCGTAAISSVNERQLSRLGASVAGGLTVTVMIYAVGHISGAHMNPAVTLAFTAVRRFPLKQVPFYAAAQLTGAISAGFTLRMLLDPSIYKLLGTTSPSGSDTQALIMEVVVTFCMMFVTSAVATDAKAIGELAVGSSVCITSILAGPISGGSMNPARTIGPALASGYYKGLWIYMVGPVMGTLLGVWAYTLITSGSPAITVTATSTSSRFRKQRHQEQAAAAATLNEVEKSKEVVQVEIEKIC